MSDVVTAPLKVHRLTPLPDSFWRGVRETPWRYDLFQLPAVNRLQHAVTNPFYLTRNRRLREIGVQP